MRGKRLRLTIACLALLASPTLAAQQDAPDYRPFAEYRQFTENLESAIDLVPEARTMIQNEVAACERAPRFPDDCMLLLDGAGRLFWTRDPLLAENYMRRSVELRVKVFGRSSEQTAHGRTMLGAFLLSRGRLAEAEREMTLAVATFRRVDRFDALGPTIDDLGTCLSAQGRYAEAEAVLREALALAQAGSNDPRDVRKAAALRALARNAVREGRDGKAEGLLRQWLATGDDSGEAALELGMNLARQGRFAEGEAMIRQSLGTSGAPGSPPDPIPTDEGVRRRGELARLLMSAGKPRAAFSEYRKVTAEMLLGERTRRDLGLLDQHRSYLRGHVLAAWRVGHAGG